MSERQALHNLAFVDSQAIWGHSQLALYAQPHHSLVSSVLETKFYPTQDLYAELRVLPPASPLPLHPLLQQPLRHSPLPKQGLLASLGFP